MLAEEYDSDIIVICFKTGMVLLSIITFSCNV